MDEKLILGQMLRKKMASENIAAIGKAVGLDRRVLHSWAYQDRVPSLKFASQLRKLANHFNLQLEELLFGVSDKKIITSIQFRDGESMFKVVVQKIE